MNARGWKTKEPGSEHLAPEEPALVASIGQMLREKGLTDAEIADSTGFASTAERNPFLPPARTLQAV